MKDIYDMIVIGGGPGGYTAALYAVRAGLETLVIEKLSAGGQMALTSQIDNYPGFEDGGCSSSRRWEHRRRRRSPAFPHMQKGDNNPQKRYIESY